MRTADYPVWLAVMPDQRDAARADAGKHPDGGNAIRWDKDEQLWYARPGADLSRLQSWLPDPSRRSGGGDPQTEFLDALTDAGLIIDGLPVMDGEIHRVSVTDGPTGNGDGVYRGFLNGSKPGGWFINYWTAKTHKDITKWKGTGGESDPVARLHMKAVARQSRDDSARRLADTHARQTAKAKALYERLPPADPDHAYLQRKGVTADDGIRQTRNGALVIPFQDVDGAFRTLQYIPPDGEKYLFSEAPKAGHFRVVGGTLTDGEPILYAEGYATARSLNEVTGRPVVMTIDAGNMLNVANVLSERYPGSPHLFMVDFDHSKPVNTGLVMGEQAALNTGGKVIIPDFTSAERAAGLTDFNDVHQSRGTEALRAELLPQIHQALAGLHYKEYVMATSDDAQPVLDNLPPPSPAAGDVAPARRPGAAKEKTDEILKLRDDGLKPAQIAEQLGIGQTSVYRILKAQQSDAAAETAPSVQDRDEVPLVETTPEVVSDEAFTPDISESASNAASSEPVQARNAQSSSESAIAVNSESSSDTVGSEPLQTSRTQLLPESADNIARAIALSASGLSLARVAAELNLGMGETHRLIQAGRQQESSLAEARSGHDKVDFSSEFSEINNRLRALRDEAGSLDDNTLAMRLGALINERIGLTEVWAMGNDTENARWPTEESEALEAELRAELDNRPGAASSPLTAAFVEENAILVGAARVSPQDEDVPGSSGSASPRIDADKLLSRITHEKQPDGQSVLYRLDGEPAFIDRGNRLVMAEGASAHEEKVLAALLTAANHYHGRIELTGSDEFKAFAIGVIVANKLDVSMKNASQQADLDAARRAAGQPATPADEVRGDPQASRAAETPPAQPAQFSEPLQNAAPVTVSPQQGPEPVPEPTTPKISPAVHTPAEKAREPVTGKVIACGQAPFRFEEGQSESTFITLRSKEGQQTFWGKELAGLLRETNLKPGRMVTLQWQGEQPVTVKVPKRDDNGVITHYENVQARRNQWSLAPVGGTRVQTGDAEMVPLTAVDVNRYTQIQHTLVSRLGVNIDAPPKPADGLYWLKPDGQGSAQPGDPLSAPRPARNERAGIPVMSAWGKDGLPDLLLVQGDGDYLQGIVRQNGSYQHVLVSLPGSAEAPPMVVNLLTPDGAQPIGNGNGINRSSGQPVPREHVVLRLTGDEQPRIAKLDAPSDVPPALHARLGYDERYKAESGWVKEQPAAAPQAAPVTPPRPAQ